MFDQDREQRVQLHPIDGDPRARVLRVLWVPRDQLLRSELSFRDPGRPKGNSLIAETGGHCARTGAVRDNGLGAQSRQLEHLRRYLHD